MQRNIGMVCADGRFRIKLNIIRFVIIFRGIISSGYGPTTSQHRRSARSQAGRLRLCLGAGERVESEADR